MQPVVMVHAYNPSEAGGCQIGGQLGLQMGTLSRKITKKNFLKESLH
jgi:hypothetical protein